MHTAIYPSKSKSNRVDGALAFAVKTLLNIENGE
jgi:hypothetical protein